MNLDYDSISPITGNKCVIVEADEKTGLAKNIRQIISGGILKERN